MNNSIIEENNSLNALLMASREDYVNYGNNELYKFIENNYKTCYGDIIISCTNLPTFHLIEQIEADFHVTVLTSNQSILFTVLSNLKIPSNSFGMGHYLGEVYDNK